MAQQYKDESNAKVLMKIDQMTSPISETPEQIILPDFCREYIRSMESVSPLTRLAYLQRISVFLRYLHEFTTYFAKKEISEITIDELGMLKKQDFDEFFHHLSVYGALSKEEIETCKKVGKYIKPSKENTYNNYLSALCSLFNYFIDCEYMQTSPVLRVKHKRKQKHVVVALDDDQKNRVLDVIENGSEFLTTPEKIKERTEIRDRAIYILGMHTGIRVSELVSLDVDDLDFRKHCFTVIRKRNKEDVVYMDDVVEAALLLWLDDRKTMMLPDDERALFVSTRGPKDSVGTRLSVRSVERMVKKYANVAVPELTGKVTPHKLRSTAVTDIIKRSNGNIYLAKSIAGHENISTTELYTKENEKEKEANRHILE